MLAKLCIAKSLAQDIVVLRSPKHIDLYKRRKNPSKKYMFRHFIAKIRKICYIACIK